MSVEQPEPPPSGRTFSKDERVRIGLALSAMKEFHDGYKMSRHIEKDLPGELALNRFFATALTAYLDGFYPASRESGLLPVLRLMGCNTLADEIQAAVETKIGDSTFGQLVNLYRDKMIAHPQFTRKGLFEVDDEWNRHMPSQAEIDVFKECTHTVLVATSAAYLQYADQNLGFAKALEDPDEVGDKSP